MAFHKLVLDEDLGAAFSLIAIHCSEEEYKMAYLLNRYLGLQLTRKTEDLDFSKGDKEVRFPIYEHQDKMQCRTFHLVSNKSAVALVQQEFQGGLFEEQEREHIVHTYLLPEFSKVDYLLKIEDDYDKVPLQPILSRLNAIGEVISAYKVEDQRIQSKTNLIFD